MTTTYPLTDNDPVIITEAAEASAVIPPAYTYDWDTAFATTFNYANKAIKGRWATMPDSVKTVKESATSPVNYSVDGTFSAWQLTVGGDGRNIRMECPLAGTYVFGNQTFTLSKDPAKPTAVVIEVGMEWVPDPGQFSFTVTDTAKVKTIKGDLDRSTIDSTLTGEFVANGKTLTGSARVILQQKGLEWLVADGANSYYIFYTADKDGNEFLTVYEFQQAWLNNLKVLGEDVTTTQPAVSIITIANNPTSGGLAGAGFESVLSEWFNAHISDFNHVFAVLDLSVELDKSDKYKWTKPTATSYAVTDKGDLASSMFGVLAMTGGNPAGTNHQVSPNAVPEGSDAGFLISGTQFMEEMMLPGARTIFNNAPATSFAAMPSGDGLTIQNTESLVWGKFMMDNKKEGSVPNQGFQKSLDAGKVSSELALAMQQNLGIYLDQSEPVKVTTAGSQWLIGTGQHEFILNLVDNEIDVYVATTITIGKGQFSMTLFPSYLEIQFIDLDYSYSSSFDVHVNYTEKITLGLQPPANKAFWYTQVLKNMTVNVTKTQAAITREIVEGAVVAVLSLVAIAGPIIEGLSAAAEIGDVSVDEGSALIDEEAFAAADDDNPVEAAEDAQDAANNAGDQANGRLTNIKNAFATPKWKAMAALAALAGAVSGGDKAISAIIEAAAKKQWQHVPAFDDFANVAIKPYTFPGIKDYELNSARIAGSLQLGMLVTAEDD